MPMQWQTVELEMRQGIDTKSDRKVVKGLLTLENGEFRNFGKINKRNGYHQLRTNIMAGGNVSAGVSIAGLGDELHLFDGTTAYSYTQNNQAGLWASRGSVFNCEARWKQVASNVTGLMSSFTNGFILYATVVSSKVVTYIVDATTNSLVLPNTIVGTHGAGFSICALGNVFCIVGLDGLNVLTCWTFDTTNLATAAWAVGWTSADADAGINVQAISTGAINGVQYGCVAYRRTGAVTIRAARFSTSALTAAVRDDASVNATPTSIAKDASGVIYVFATISATTISARGVNDDATYTEAFSSVNIDAGGTAFTSFQASAAACPSGSTAQLFVQDKNATQQGIIRTAIINNAGTITLAAANKLYNFNMLSKAFVVGSTVYYAVAPLNGHGPIGLFIIDQNNNAWARVAAGATGLSTGIGLSEFVAISTNKYLFAAPGVYAPGTTTITRYNAITFDLAPARRIIAGNVNSHDICALGGLFYAANTQNYSENGFFHGPGTMTAVGSAPGTGAVAPGNYSYYAVYRWTDATGKLYNSALSPALAFTQPGGDDTVTVTVPTYTLGIKPNTAQTAIQIELYRTQASGTTYYFVTAGNNTTSAATIGIIDAVSDAVLATHRVLYTTGGILESQYPEASRYMLVANNRVWLIVDDNEIWYSKQISLTTGVEFHSSLQTIFDATGGKLIALAEMDGTIFVLRERAIEAFNGDGPNNLGVGSFSPTRIITHDVGCRDPRSVVTTQDGIFFQSQDGLYMLTRALEVVNLGLPVFKYDSGVTTSAQYLVSRSQLRFVKDTGGPMLVHDVTSKQWSTFTSSAWTQFIETTVWQNKHVGLRSNGTVWVQDGTFVDGETAVPMKLSTGWVNFSKLQDYKRVRGVEVLGEKMSDHTLMMHVYYDYSDTIAETVTFDAKAAMPAGDQLYQFRHRFARQKCETIRLDFVDSKSLGTKESYSITAILFEVGGLPGVNRLGAAKTV